MPKSFTVSLLFGVLTLHAEAHIPPLPTETNAGAGNENAVQSQLLWQSTEEYNAWKAASDARDPKQKLFWAEAFIKKYPTSAFIDLGYIEEIKAYHALGQGDKAMQAALEALKLKADNYDALQYEAFLLPYVYEQNAPGSADMLTRGESDARKALDLLSKSQKPANVTDEQYVQYVKGKRALFNATLGYTALQRKDYAGAITYLKAATEDNPNDTLTFSLLGQAYVNSSPPYYDNAIWYLARSVALAKASSHGQCSSDRGLVGGNQIPHCDIIGLTT